MEAAKTPTDSELLGGNREIKPMNPVIKIMKDAPVVGLAGVTVVGSLAYGLMNMGKDPLKSGKAMTARVAAQVVAVTALVSYVSFTLGKHHRAPGQ